MNIGTPLSKNALKVMLLGGGELGKEIVISFQRFGVETIVVDRYPDSPAMQVAHQSHVIDMTNPIMLRQLIEKIRPQIIVPEIEAIATNILIEIEKENISQVIPTARAVHLTMNRAGIRRLAHEELQLPTSKYQFARNLNELKEAINNHIGYPCFIKPVMSSSGKGQSFVKNEDGVEKAWEHALNSGRVNKMEVIVEECINFDFEITLLTVRARDIGGEINTFFCNPIGHVQISGDYVESWQPQVMSPKALLNAQHIAKAITDNLGGCGVFGVELFVKGDMVWFSEVSPRPHDTGMVTMITQYQNEFELHARAILGFPVDTRQKEVGASSVIYAESSKTEIIYKNIEKALQVPNSDIRLFGKPVALNKRRRMGVALACADDTKTARDHAKLVSSQIVITNPI